MLALYDEQQILESYVESEKYEAAKEADIACATEMIKDNVPVNKILKYLPSLTEDDIEAIQEKLGYRN